MREMFEAGDLDGDVEQLQGSKATSLFTDEKGHACLLYTSPSPRDATLSRMPSSA